MNFSKRQSGKIGLMPGSYVFVGEKKQEEIQINLMDYNEENYEFRTLDNIDEALPYKDNKNITWINIYGLHETAILEKIEKYFNIHSLVMEDVLNTNQRPKLEIYDDYIFAVIKMIYFDDEDYKLTTEQISLILCENYIICFQERKGDFFNPLRERIKSGKGRARKSGADYLAYTILDMIVDNYFISLEKLGDEIEALDVQVLEDPDPDLAQQINSLKRSLILMRRNTWPLREVISMFVRDQLPYFRTRTLPFLRDLYDHTLQVVDTTEIYIEMVNGLLEMHMSAMSNRLNEVMKVLTIIATIFIPLSFLAGVYGMNFDTGAGPFNMPELHYRYGYAFFWLLVLIVGGGLVVYFKKKKWM